MSPGPKKQPGAPDPLRNLRNDEVLAIISRPDFTPPEGVGTDEWGKAVGAVRSALTGKGKINLDLALDPGNPRVSDNFCKPADAIVAGALEKDESLRPLAQAIRRVREEIAILLRIRVSITRHPQYPAFLKIVKQRKGQVTMKELREKKSEVGNFVINLYDLARPFGAPINRKKAAWRWICEFLSEQSGYTVEFIDQKFIATPRRAAGGAAKVAAPKGPRTARPHLPEGISLREVSATRRSVERILANLLSAARLLHETLPKQIAGIDRMIEAEGKERMALEHQLAGQQRGSAYERELKGVRKKYDDLLESLRGLDEDAALPRDLQTKMKKDIAAVDAKYSGEAAARKELEKQHAAVERKIALLKAEKQRLEKELKDTDAKLKILEGGSGLQTHPLSTGHSPSLSPVLSEAEGLERGPGGEFGGRVVSLATPRAGADAETAGKITTLDALMGVRIGGAVFALAETAAHQEALRFAIGKRGQLPPKGSCFALTVRNFSGGGVALEYTSGTQKTVTTDAEVAALNLHTENPLG